MTATNTQNQFDTNGYYAVVQYCPDASRQESANVGVILLVPSLNYIGGVEDPTNARAHRFFGHQITDWSFFDMSKKQIFDRIVKDKNYFRHESDLERFSTTRGNSFILTLPKPVKVDKAPFLVLSELFDELVKEKEEI
jgi:hypothetical protein